MARDIEKQIRLQLDEAGYTADKVTFRCVIEEKKRAWTFILHDLTVATPADFYPFAMTIVPEEDDLSVDAALCGEE